jgi:hypothetical protein
VTFGSMRAAGKLDDEAAARRLERQEFRRRQLLALANRAGWPQLRLEDLSFGRFGRVEHTDGRVFRVFRGEPAEVGPIRAWYRDGDSLGFLE